MRPENSKTNNNDDENLTDNVENIARDPGISGYCTLQSGSTNSSTSNETESRSISASNNMKSLENFYTVGRRFKKPTKTNPLESNLPYTEFHNSNDKNSAYLPIVNNGLSNDLSTESIKNACDYFELSDEDSRHSVAGDQHTHPEAVNRFLLNRIQDQLPTSFQRSSPIRSSARSSAADHRIQQKQFHPYCTLRRDKRNHTLIQTAPEKPLLRHLSSDHGSSNCNDSTEALHILSELDAILDNHETLGSAVSPQSSSSSPTTSIATRHSETPGKVVEDYLLELDAYLEEIDRISTNTSNMAAAASTIADLDKQVHRRSTSSASSSSLANTQPQPTRLLSIVGQTVPKRLSTTLPKPPRKTTSTGRKSENGNDFNCDQALIRGHNFRNTLATHCNGSAKAKRSIERFRSWRRHSMRKTSPIILPNEQPILDIIPTLETNSTSERFQSDHSNDQAISISGTRTPARQFAEPAISQEFYNLQTRCNENNSNSRICLSDGDLETRNDLTHLDIINDILNSSCESYIASPDRQQRPRQLGRRAEARPRVVSIMAETNSTGSQRIIVSHERPISAPVTFSRRSAVQSSSTPASPSEGRYVGSEPSSVGSSRNPSPVSIVSSTASSSMVSAVAEQPTDTTPTRQRAQSATEPEESQSDDRESRSKELQWPHGFSRTLALLCCTLGLFNISRFSVFSIHFGANFLVQFLILSIVFGIPLLWLQMCLGAKIKRGPVTMWKISPICRGIGISLLICQCVIALYSAISLGWILIYFKDSFVSRSDHYKWQESFELYRGPGNNTNNLVESVADYFSGVVLQRLQLGPAGRVGTGGIRFQLAFNLAILWTAVFIVLCKGLQSFGKIALGLTLLPLVLFIAVCSKLLSMIDFSSVQSIFPATDWPDFFLNSRSWMSAAQETFLTWGLLGASVIAISSKSAEKCEGKTILRRDAILVVILTLFGLFMAAIFGNACVQILQNHGYLYFPGSYENIETYIFLYPVHTSIPPQFISTPSKWLPRYSTVMGEYFRRPGINPLRESGYQTLRLATEIFPATLAAATQEFLPPIWSLMGYLMLLIFGLGQLCAMWKPISSVLGHTTSSALLSCVTGLLLGIPFASEMGLTIIHYLDVVIGGAWWILVLWSAQIFAVFLIRGRPYNGDVLVNDLRLTQTLSAFLALSWNVLLPIGLITLSIIEYKVSNTREFFYWRGNSYFHYWARKIGGFVQISFLLLIPITSIIQIYRYLSKGPPDILDRIQLLYRPSPSSTPTNRSRPFVERPSYQQQATTGAVTLSNVESQSSQDDAPPKYTPPPSYTTATGARLAKMLRQSIRRSVRRILGEPSRTRPTISTNPNGTAEINPSLPPAYSTVLSNPSGDENCQQEIGPRVLYNSHTQRSLSLERQRPSSAANKKTPVERTSAVAVGSCSTRGRSSQTFSAFDVAKILRPSHRHERSASAITSCVDHVLNTSSIRQKHSRSAENLVLNAAPLGESSIITVATNIDPSSNDENTSVI